MWTTTRSSFSTNDIGIWFYGHISEGGETASRLLPGTTNEFIRIIYDSFKQVLFNGYQ